MPTSTIRYNTWVNADLSSAVRSVKALQNLVVKILDLSAGSRVVVLNAKDAEQLGVTAWDRINLSSDNGRSIIVLVDITKSIVEPHCVGMPMPLASELRVQDGVSITANPIPPPVSVKYVQAKIHGAKLGREEVYAIVKDVVSRNLSDVEMAAFVMAEHYYGLNDDELLWLTRAIAETGTQIDFEKPVYDKHSIGGVPGNKVTLIVVPIAAAAGLLIPKTSSRAITSPSGTADTMSVLAPVEFSAQELRRIALKIGGAIVWGGGLSIAPADDAFITVEYPLRLDPEPQMIASILAKKLAVGTDFLVLDLPTGEGTKIANAEDARRLGNRFIGLGGKLGIRVRCGVTYGGQPVGHAVGPALEAKEALQTLEGVGPASLVEKSTSLAGMLLELAGKAVKGEGQALAKQILQDGRALKKMKEIIEEQGGDSTIKSAQITVGQHRQVILAPIDGFVTDVSNAAINQIARTTGAPVERGSGLVLFGKRGHKVGKGEPILEIYAERRSKLEEACAMVAKLQPVTIEGMLLEEITDI
jgi:AMP phosphorylase